MLNVFGFTSEQTVADLTDKILRGETPEAIDLLHAQCEAGKDMMKLMSDLISYLRDLLVFKVKPDALAEDVESGVAEIARRHKRDDRDRPAARVDRSIRRSGRPHEMGAEQEAAFRSRDDQGHPNAWAK